jgi:hypothetical protein
MQDDHQIPLNGYGSKFKNIEDLGDHRLKSILVLLTIQLLYPVT